MFKRRFFKIIPIVFIIIVIISSVSVATNPIFDIIIRSDTTKINKGESITFNLYLVGLGNVSKDYLLFYVDNNMYVSNFTIMGFSIKSGLQNKGTNVQICVDFMKIAKQGFEDYTPEVINPLYAGILKNETYIPPVKVTITTDKNVSPGDHDLEIIYLFEQNGSNNWTEISKTQTFHINTDIEQNEWKGFLWNIAQPGIGFLIALGIFALGLFCSKKKEKNIKSDLKKNLLLMLNDEIEYNLEKVQQMQRDIPKKYLIPNYRLKTGNKDACWGKIIEFRSEEHDFINDISKLYGKYDLLNKTIDVGIGLFNSNNTNTLSTEIIRICGKIEKDSEEVIKKYFKEENKQNC